VSTLSRDARERLAAEFVLNAVDVEYWAGVLAGDLRAGPFRHEPELIGATQWAPEKADAFVAALRAALRGD
jgi:hypothetical protein